MCAVLQQHAIAAPALWAPCCSDSRPAELQSLSNLAAAVATRCRCHVLFGRRNPSQARGSSAVPLVELMYRQTAVLLDELKRQGLPAALVLDVPGLCLAPSGGGSGRQQQPAAGVGASSSQQGAAAVRS